MTETTEEVIVTPNTEDEIIVEEEDGDNEELELEDDYVEDERDVKIRELEVKNKKLYSKLKGGYKKHAEDKNKINTEYVSKDDVRTILQEMETDRTLEQKLVNTYDDAAELLPDIKKIMKEDGLSIDKAYALVQGKLMSDEKYRNQVNQGRTANHGTFRQTEIASKADTIFSQGPSISKPIE